MTDIQEAKVSLIEGMHFRADSGSGFAIDLDAGDEAGGQNRGARPLELLLMGLGGCTAMDVISILRKMQQDVTGYKVSVQGTRATEHPKVYTRIVVEHKVLGKALAPDRVRRAVELSATKYCPASAMLSKAAPVVHRYVIVDSVSGSVCHEGSLEETTAP